MNSVVITALYNNNKGLYFSLDLQFSKKNFDCKGIVQ